MFSLQSLCIRQISGDIKVPKNIDIKQCCYSINSRIAAVNGRLDCLKYAYKSIHYFDNDICELSVENGYLECLKYAHKNGCRMNVWTCVSAAKNGRVECLKYTHENNCP